MNWFDIVDEANAFGRRQAIRSCEEVFEGLATKASLKKINRWQKDHKKTKNLRQCEITCLWIGH